LLSMRHVTYSDKSLLVGNAAADLLIEYAAVLGRHAGSDVVTLNAIGSDGNEVEASFLLNPSTMLMVETASTAASEPDNRSAVGYLRGRIDELSLLYDLRTDGWG
jgi:hypothetical protein